jgi:hypothetical protein
MRKHHVWVVERKFKGCLYRPTHYVVSIRHDARVIVDYLNGFAKGKKRAVYRVKKYVSE